MRRCSTGGRRLLVWLGAKGASVLAIASTLATSSCSRGSLLSTYNRMRGDPYALDDYDRTVDDSGDVVCPELELQTFRGSSVKFSPAVEVTEPFATRLQRFERVLVEVSRRHYRRAPIRTMLGPGHPTHASHFHFDMAPYSYVQL